MPEDQKNLEHYHAHLHLCAVWWFVGEKTNTLAPKMKGQGSQKYKK